MSVSTCGSRERFGCYTSGILCTSLRSIPVSMTTWRGTRASTRYNITVLKCPYDLFKKNDAEYLKTFGRFYKTFHGLLFLMQYNTIME